MRQGNLGRIASTWVNHLSPCVITTTLPLSSPRLSSFPAQVLTAKCKLHVIRPIYLYTWPSARESYCGPSKYLCYRGHTNFNKWWAEYTGKSDWPLETQLFFSPFSSASTTFHHYLHIFSSSSTSKRRCKPLASPRLHRIDESTNMANVILSLLLFLLWFQKKLVLFLWHLEESHPLWNEQIALFNQSRSCVKQAFKLIQ